MADDLGHHVSVDATAKRLGLHAVTVGVSVDRAVIVTRVAMAAIVAML